MGKSNTNNVSKTETETRTEAQPEDDPVMRWIYVFFAVVFAAGLFMDIAGLIADK